MPLFPAFLNLTNRLVVVVGGGTVAQSKIPALLDAGAHVRVVAPQINPQLAEWARHLRVEWLPKLFAADDLSSAFLVIAATALPAVNEHVYRAAERHILCNAPDDIDHCNFYYGSVVQRGDLQIAISTNGKSPALAQRIRKELELAYADQYGEWLDWLGAVREVLRADPCDPELRKELLHELASQESFERYRRSRERREVA